MERLTTNKPYKDMKILERAHNDVYMQDGEAWYRDHNTKVSCRDVIRHIFTEKGIDPGTDFFIEDNCFEEYMYDLLQYGFNTLEGIIAILYLQMWSKCNLRERLKEYEDTGLTPEQIKDIDRLYTEKCKELGKERQKRICEPEYLGENTAIGCRNGMCKCKNIVRSYQNFCDQCGIKLDW